MSLDGRFEINFEAATGVRGREREGERACARLGERERGGERAWESEHDQCWVSALVPFSPPPPPPEQTDDASAPAPLSAVRTVRGVSRSSPESLWRNSNYQTPAGRCASAPPPSRNEMRLPPARPRRSSPAAVTLRC